MLVTVTIGYSILILVGCLLKIFILIHFAFLQIEGGSNVSDDGRVGDSTALVVSTCNEEQT